jgi:hypothetical protein
MGHAIVGVPSRRHGQSRRTGSHWSFLDACDARLGILQYNLYSRGTIKGKFLLYANTY